METRRGPLGADAHPRLDDAFLRGIESGVTPADWLMGICTSYPTPPQSTMICGGFLSLRMPVNLPIILCLSWVFLLHQSPRFREELSA